MYQIRYDSKRVQKGLKKLPVKEQERIIKCIENRLINFRTRTKGIRRIKTTGEYRLRQGDYRIDGIAYISKSYDTGYSIHLDLPSRNATESQSLNYKTPLYNLAQKMLAFMGVSVQVRTMVD